jgi:PKD repeat protein
LTFENIVFDGSGSSDTSNGTIANYTWDFGDETNNGYGVRPTHSYSSPGIYNVILTVTDNDGLTDSDTAIANITLDSDGDGWSDDEEEQYGTNITNFEDEPQDTDDDRLPDIEDEDDDDDGLPDDVENIIGSDPKDDTDSFSFNIDDSQFYLVDIDNDGVSDKLYDTIGRITEVQAIDDGKYLLDTDGDGVWNYIYEPASDSIIVYAEKEEPEGQIPVIFIIIFIVVMLIISIIGVLFKTGFILIEKSEE